MNRKPAWPSGPILDVFPVDAERAVVARSGQISDEKYVLLVNAQGEPAWKARLPSYVPGKLPTRTSATSPEFVTFRSFEPGGTIRTYAFATASGAPSWQGGDSGLPGRTALGEDNPSAQPGTAATIGADRELFEIYDADSPYVIALERATGKELWRKKTEPQAGLQRVWLRTQDLVLEQRGRITLLNRKSGERRDPAIAAPACLLDERLLYLDASGDLHQVSLADGKDAVALRGLAPVSPAPGTQGTQAAPNKTRLLGLCAQHGDDLVLAVEHGPTRSELVGLSGKADAVRWRIDLSTLSLDLGGKRLESAVRLSYPDATSFAGKLPRFLPLLLEDRQGYTDQGAYRSWPLVLAVIDLQEHKLQRRTLPADANLTSAYLLQHGGRSYLAANNTLALFNGTTGSFERVQRFAGARAVQPYHFGSGRIWLSGASGISALDATTLAPVSASGAFPATDLLKEWNANQP